MGFGVSFLIGVIIGILIFYHNKEKKERLKAKREREGGDRRED